MNSNRTFSGAFGLVCIAAALWSGSAIAAGPTPEAIRADGLRWQATARAYGVHTVTTPSQSSSGSGFDFGAAAIGALAALGLAVIASGLMVMARRDRRTKHAD